MLRRSQQEHIRDFIARGGNLLIAGEPKFGASHLNTLLYPLGIRFAEEALTQPNDDYTEDLIQSVPTTTLTELSAHFEFMKTSPRVITMPGTTILEPSGAQAHPEFEALPILQTSKGTAWHGDSSVSYPTGMILQRKIGGKSQRIAVLGDADFMSNVEISMRRKGVRSSNFIFVTGIFNWLSEGLAPLDTSRPLSIDNALAVRQEAGERWGMVYKYAVPLILVLSGTFLLFFRRRR